MGHQVVLLALVDHLVDLVVVLAFVVAHHYAFVGVVEVHPVVVVLDVA